MQRGRPIYLGGNDFECVNNLTRRAVTTGLLEPAIGLTLSAFLSATPTGATIDGSLSKAATERSSTPGEYFAIMEGTDLVAQLASYDGKDVYEIFGNQADVNYVTAHQVRAVRP